MTELTDFNLIKHNSLRLHSIAKQLYIPESYDDLATLMKSFSNGKKRFYILSSGSNVLLKPIIKTPVIYLGRLDTTLEYIRETNTVVAGCSVKIQTLINFLAENNLGGIEYLFSLPALTGGCVCMNAGRAREHNLSISDYITSVEYFDGEGLKKIEKDKCGFSYRTSVFQEPGKIITKAFFTFPYQEKEITKKKIKERVDFVKVYQEPQKPSLGTIFSAVDKRIIRKMKGLRIGDAAYSKKTQNWISNLGNAKYSQVITLINIVKLISFVMRKKAKLEIKIWS